MYVHLLKLFLKNPAVFFRNIAEVLRFRRSKPYDMIFFVVRPFQETYVNSTLEALQGKNYRIAWVRHELGAERADGKWDDPPGDVDIYRIAWGYLQFLQTKIFITPDYANNLAFLPRAKWQVHIPHFIVSLQMTNPPGSFRAFNVMFAVGEHHVQEMKLLRAVRPDCRVYRAGYGRMDFLLKEYAEHKPDTWYGNKKLVLIAPSWHEGNILRTIGPELTAKLLDEGYAVVFRPHYKIGERNPEFLKELEEQFAGNEYFRLQVAGANNKALYDADLMICDFSGVALEYALLRERPVMFADTKPKVRNPEWEELDIKPAEIRLRSLIGKIVPIDSDTMLAAVPELINNREAYREAIIKARDEICFNFSSGAGTQIAKYLNELAEETQAN